MCDQLTAWASKVGKSPKRAKRLLPPPGLTDQMHVLAAAQVEAAYRCVGWGGGSSSWHAVIKCAAWRVQHLHGRSRTHARTCVCADTQGDVEQGRAQQQGRGRAGGGV
jgi:hypothetical protein